MARTRQQQRKAAVPSSSSTGSAEPKRRGRPPGSTKKQRGRPSGSTSRKESQNRLKKAAGNSLPKARKTTTQKAQDLLDRVAIQNGPSQDVDVEPVDLEEEDRRAANSPERSRADEAGPSVARKWEKKTVENSGNVRRVEMGRHFDLRQSASTAPSKTPRFVNNRKVLKRSQSADSRRTNSVEEEASPNHDMTMRRSFSLLDFEEIQKFAENRLNDVANKFELSILHFELKEREATKKRLRSVIATNQIFSEIPCDDTFRTFDILVDIFSPKGTTLHELDVHQRMATLMGKVIPKYGLGNVGEVRMREPKTMFRRATISKVMKDYQEFNNIVREALKEPMNAMNSEMDSLQNSFRDPLYSMLFQSYKAAFAYNRYLVQHLFQFLAQHLFNQFDVHEAIISNNFWKLRMRIKLVRDKVPQIMRAFFNVEPLSRQLEDMEKVRPKLTRVQIKEHVATLARIAMEQVRVPATAKLPNANYYWQNEKDFYRDTFDLLHLKSGTPIHQSNFNKFISEIQDQGYDRKDVYAHCIQFHHTRSSKFVTLFRGFFDQSVSFFESFKEFMPDSRLDRKMKIFLQRQCLKELWKVVQEPTNNEILNLDKMSSVDAAMIVSTIISKPNKNLVIYEKLCREKMNNLYRGTLESPYSFLSVSPSYIGVIIVTLDDQMFVSILKEDTPMIEELDEPEGLDENGEEPISQTAVVKKYPDLKHKDYLYMCTDDDPSAEVLLSLDPKTGDYWISLTQEGEPRKSERAYMGCVDLTKIAKNGFWETLEQQTIIPVRNVLKDTLNERSPDRNAISAVTANFVEQLLLRSEDE